MQSVSTLRNTINHQLTDVESKRILVDSLVKSAEQHEANGDDVRARLDRESAERYLRDLSTIENNIAGYESEITKREQKAREIEKRIDDLNQHFKRDLEQLEKDKNSVAMSVLAGSDIEAIKRKVKNKDIDKKEEELQKHYDHNLQKLINEQKLVLG